MSFYSVTQLRHAIFKEIEEWSVGYELNTEFDELTDLTDTIINLLDDGDILHPDFPETLETEKEHYNDIKTYR